MAKSDLKPCMMVVGNYLVGFDPGYTDDDDAAVVVMQRESNGKVRVLSTERFKPGEEASAIAKAKDRVIKMGDLRRKVTPLIFHADCTVCDRERVVFVGFHADMIQCPACIGVSRMSVDGLEREDIERMCAEANVPPRWVD